MKKLVWLWVFWLATAQGQEAESLIRICDDTGCSDRPRSTATFTPASPLEPGEQQRLAALIEVARRDPTASYDLGLRFFRGDGVRQDSYQALQWLKDAAERGVVPAQLNLGRLYLSGLEEMGADPVAAEKWLMIAASRGNDEAAQLLKEASAAKRKDEEYRRFLAREKELWYRDLVTNYVYSWRWRDTVWVFYR